VNGGADADGGAVSRFAFELVKVQGGFGSVGQSVHSNASHMFDPDYLTLASGFTAAL
jgi:hypothetical protein